MGYLEDVSIGKKNLNKISKNCLSILIKSYILLANLLVIICGNFIDLCILCYILYSFFFNTLYFLHTIYISGGILTGKNQNIINSSEDTHCLSFLLKLFLLEESEVFCLKKLYGCRRPGRLAW